MASNEKKVRTCPVTKKTLKRVKRYYRAGVYYLNKKSYQTAVQEAKAKEAGKES